MHAAMVPLCPSRQLTDVLPDLDEQQLPLLKHILLIHTLRENSKKRRAALKVFGYHQLKLEVKLGLRLNRSFPPFRSEKSREFDSRVHFFRVTARM